ncbi:thymic stromal cotransporter homolog [Triplophysa dalaica]|uniref:thymic stromal cotransporter homolog n=1 Tax=Triplophysa dalaica TaxID=1582913 RepID=UPI0024DFA107|nr:thymic stromal cotransporter homolog [Triplophysa dalaica]
MGIIMTLVEPVVVINKLGTSFFEMALTQTIYNHSLKTTAGDSDRAQTLSSRFLLIQSVVSSVAALLSIIPLSRIADHHGPKVFVVASQMGSVLGMFMLLIFMYSEVPLEFLYLGSLLHGLSGGGPMFWAGVAALAALSSEKGKRTLKLNIVDFCFGVAGVVGGLLSGYLYQIGPSVLLSIAILVSVVALLYSVFLLSDVRCSESESEPLLPESESVNRMDKISVGILMVAMMVFMVGMIGAENVLQLYVLKPPLSWNSVWAGYGRAATSAMYLSSFLGVLILFNVLGDTALTLVGIVSNCAGMAIMGFAIESWVYFLARGIMMFACVPMPTLRAMLSKNLHPQQYGRVFGLLQLVLAVTELLSNVFFTSIYPLTLSWFAGFCFLLSSGISYMSTVPILYLNGRIRHEAI